MKIIIIILSSFLLCCVVSAIIIYAYVYHDAQALPSNSPGNYLSFNKILKQDKPLVICAGDSITHGTVSVNYVNILGKRLNTKEFAFVNAGINSELAWNLKQRLDEIISCHPAFITILIGSNDANGTLDPKTAARQIKSMKLPQSPGPEWFRKNLEEVCSILKEKTSAKIALLSLPPIGEETNSNAYRRAAEYSTIIKETAKKMKVAYLPLNETMDRGLISKKTKPKVIYRGDPEPVLYKTLAQHYLGRMSFDEIAERNGFLYLTDLLHLNTRGAELTADLIENFILRHYR